MAKNGPGKWHGGKSYLAEWIHRHAPPSHLIDPENGYTHRIYAYGGMMGEAWSWDHAGIAEVYNDASLLLTNFFRVLQCPIASSKLYDILQNTPFSETEFIKARDICLYYTRAEPDDDRFEEVHHGLATDPIGVAWAFFVMNRMSREGLGKDYATPTTRIRRDMNEHVSAFLSAAADLLEFRDRMRLMEVRWLRVQKLINAYDHERAFFYFDPPYWPDTRESVGQYGHWEMTEADHIVLLRRLSGLKGKFLLSGYRNPVYDEYAEACGWSRVDQEIVNHASGAKTKPKVIESLWFNYDLNSNGST